MHICDPSIQEVEAEVLVQGQPGLQREALFRAGVGQVRGEANKTPSLP